MAMDKALTGWIVAIAPKMVPAATAQYILTFLISYLCWLALSTWQLAG